MVIHSFSLYFRFYLLPLNEYKYLIQGESRPDKKDLSRFEALQVAFSIFQIPQDYVNGIFSTLSAILLLGNLEFEVRAIDKVVSEIPIIFL